MISSRSADRCWLGLALSFSLWAGCAPEAAEEPSLGSSQQALASPTFTLLDAKYWGGFDEFGKPIGDGFVAAGRNGAVDVAALGDRTYVSAFPANLSVITLCLWRVPTNGGIEQRSCVDHDFYNPRRVSLTRIDDRRFVMATFDDADENGGAGKLHLTSWVVSADESSFSLKGTRDESRVYDVDVQSMNVERGTVQSNGAFGSIDFVAGVLPSPTSRLVLLNYMLESNGTITRRSVSPADGTTVTFNAGTLHLARAPGSVRTIVSGMYAGPSTAEATAGTPRVLYSWDVAATGAMTRKQQNLSSGDAFTQLVGYGSRKIATLEQHPVTPSGSGSTAVRAFNVDASNNITQLTGARIMTPTSGSETIYSSALAAGRDGRLYVSYATSRNGRKLMALDATTFAALATTSMEHSSFGDGVSMIPVLWPSDPVVVWQTNHPENVEPVYHLATEAYRLQ